MLRATSERTTKLRFFLAIGAVSLVAFSLYSAQVQVNSMTPRQGIIYDQSFVEVSRKISDSVPNGETIVVSRFEPHFVYFTEHEAVIPYGVTSKDSLVYIMKSSSWNYLVVVENSSSEEALDQLFSTSGLGQLDDDFDKLETYSSDSSKFHLYKLRLVE